MAVFAALDAAAIPYMLVGSLASNFHGIPRSTRDADFVIALEADSLRTLDARLPAGLILERQGAFEAVTGTMRYLIVLAESPFVCELFVLSDDAHDRERFARRQAVGTGALARGLRGVGRRHDHHEAALGSRRATRQGPRRYSQHPRGAGGRVGLGLHRSMGARP